MHKLIPTNAALLPDDAKRVYHGRIFDVYNWPQAMFDGSTKTFEMLKRPDTVQIIVVRDRQIALVEDEQPGRSPQIHFPGGRTNQEDDSWLIAAQRELREETGIVCKTWRLVDVKQPLIKIEWFAPIFLATDIIEELEQEVDLDGEKITVLWRDFDDVRQQVLSGREQMMEYLLPFFNRIDSLETLLALPEYQGLAVDR